MEQWDKRAQEIAESVKKVRSQISSASSGTKNKALERIAKNLESDVHLKSLLEANAQDVEAAKEVGLSPSLIDRLSLNKERLVALAGSVRELIKLSDPIGAIEDVVSRPSGIQVGRMRVPLGTLLMVYESRPNVTIDSAALCLKTGNAVILRGGKESLLTNKALVTLVHDALVKEGLPKETVTFLDETERSLLYALLRQEGLIDLAIPRGGQSLIEAVVAHARVPVIQHYKGVCHVYVHASACQNMAESIVLNAKIQRPGVCNAMEGLVVDRQVAREFVPRMVRAFAERNVKVLGCEETFSLFNETPPNLYPAKPADFDTEFLDLICTLKIVSGYDEAVSFLDKHGSRHTESIVTADYGTALRFLREVDASCVLVNASTRFNDGGELGLGAELGISTTKLHAYGPMGLSELCARKFVVLGHGETR